MQKCLSGSGNTVSYFGILLCRQYPRNAAIASASWLLTHFGDWIRTFTFIPSQRNGENLPLYDLTKADYIKWLNKADVFIEDNENNIAGLEQLNIRRFIVARPWNSSKIGAQRAFIYTN